MKAKDTDNLNQNWRVTLLNQPSLYLVRIGAFRLSRLFSMTPHDGQSEKITLMVSDKFLDDLGLVSLHIGTAYSGSTISAKVILLQLCCECTVITNTWTWFHYTSVRPIVDQQFQLRSSYYSSAVNVRSL